jgi:multiple antibiotic resistance protein
VSFASVAVLLGRAVGERWWHAPPVLGAIAVTALAAWGLLSFASRVDRVLGRTGLAILERVAGLLLAAIAFQFLVDGVVDVVGSLRG